jgi:hypothetical protein
VKNHGEAEAMNVLPWLPAMWVASMSKLILYCPRDQLPSQDESPSVTQ